MYIYHCYAIHPLPLGGVEHMDGLIVRDKPISGDWEEYQAIKKAIYEREPEKITICSLTLLSS